MDAFEMFELEKLRPLIERCQLQEHRCNICGSPTTGFGVFTPDNERNFRLQGISQIPQQDNTAAKIRSEEHTSELQSQSNLVCRLLLEKKKKKQQIPHPTHAINQLT